MLTPSSIVSRSAYTNVTVCCDVCGKSMNYAYWSTVYKDGMQPLCEDCIHKTLDKRFDMDSGSITFDAKTFNEQQLERLRENLPEHIKLLFPNVTEDYLYATLSELQLYNDKNHDYAAGGSPYGNFERVALLLANYPNFPYSTPEGVAVIYALKQLDAVLWQMSNKHQMRVEGLDGRLADIHIYVKIIRAILMAKKEKKI